MSTVPSNLMYTSGGKSVAIASSRREVIVVPQNGTGPYEQSQDRVIRIELSPSLGYLDTHESFLSFRIRPVPGTYDDTKECRMDKSALSWVRRLTILSSTGSKLEDIDEYGLLSCMLHEQTGGLEYAKTIGTMTESLGNRASRNAACAHPEGAQYVAGFDASGILNSQQVLPLAFCQGPVTIELDIQDMSKSFKFTPLPGVTPKYEVRNIQYHASVLSMSEEYSAKMSSQVRERGVDLSFETTKTHVTHIQNPDVDLPISQNAASVRGTYHILRDRAVVDSASHDSLSTYKSGNLEELQFDLGGHLTPTQSIKLKADGVTGLYQHNLQAWNMNRNQAIGSKVDQNNFHSTEAGAPPIGNAAGSYQALPTSRVYGTWVCNNADRAFKGAETVSLPSGSLVNGTALTAEATGSRIYSVPTLTFIPSDARDAHLITAGQRCKMGLAALPASESTSAADKVLVKSQQTITLGGGLVASGTTPTLLNAVSCGLRRFCDSTPTGAASSGTDGNAYTHVSHVGRNQSCLFAGTAQATRFGYEVANVDQYFTSGMGIPFTDGLNNGIFSKNVAFAADGWCDVLPDDSQFFISNSFETHGNSAPDLVSGSDLTSSGSPLYVKLKFDSSDTQAKNVFEARHQQDQFVSFVSIDAVLRLTPEGSLISSV
jgi:hypothetical protein